MSLKLVKFLFLKLVVLARRRIFAEFSAALRKIDVFKPCGVRLHSA